MTNKKNLKSLMDLTAKWIDRAAQRRSLDKLILDPNTPVPQTHGRRERARTTDAGSEQDLRTP